MEARSPLLRFGCSEGSGGGLSKTCSLWSRVTGNAKLVAFRVAEVCAVVVGVVFGPQARGALRSAAIGDSGSMSLIDDGSGLGKKGDHLPVANFVRLLVVRPADQEQGPRVWMRLPASPRTLALAKALVQTEYGHQRTVERKRTFKVRDADEDVGEQGADREGFL